MAGPRWSELSTAQRAAVIAAACVQVGLAASAWTDLARRPARAGQGSQGVVAAAIAVNFVGPLAYFRWGRTRSP